MGAQINTIHSAAPLDARAADERRFCVNKIHYCSRYYAYANLINLITGIITNTPFFFLTRYTESCRTLIVLCTVIVL